MEIDSQILPNTESGCVCAVRQFRGVGTVGIAEIAGENYVEQLLEWEGGDGGRTARRFPRRCRTAAASSEGLGLACGHSCELGLRELSRENRMQQRTRFQPIFDQ